MADDGGTKGTSSGQNDDTMPADSPPDRSSVPAIPPPPDHRYRLGQELGRGGMGRVVEAYDTHLQRTVALKEVLPKAGNIDRRFQREVRITARLEHASIVPLYDSGRLADGRAFYVMRRVSGKPLDEAIARARDLEGRLALLPNALAAIDAVAHAHARGVIHRDLKPQNILVGELGETVVIDWGLAKVVGDTDEPVNDSLEPKLPTAADSLQTQVGSVMGTPGFMPPEQARGDELGPPGDVYALGATLYQVIVGKPPFGGTSATDVIGATLRHRLVPVTKACPAAPPELVTIIEKALAFDPKHRYRDASELGEDVRRFMTGQLVAAHRYTRRQRIARFAKRNRAPLVVAALASVGIAALAWVSVHRIVQERDSATSASIEARDQRKRADDRAAELRDRADELTLLHARSVLESNPTQAIAILKEVADSPNANVLDEARGLASAAVMRGVAWGLPALGDFTISLEMTADGTRVLQSDRSGKTQVIDLDHRKVIATYSGPFGTDGMWVDHDRKILFNPTRAAPVLFDPTTSTAEPLSSASLSEVTVSSDGMRVAAIDRDYRLVIIDVATKQVTTIPDRHATAVLVARDGSWIAFGEQLDAKRARLVVVDPAGHTLFEHDGTVGVMGASDGGKLAVSFRDTSVVEFGCAAPFGAAAQSSKAGPCQFGQFSSVVKPTITKLPAIPTDLYGIHQLYYRDDQLFLLGVRTALTWQNGKLGRLREMSDGAMFMTELANKALALTSGDGQIYLMQDALGYALKVTQRPDGVLRVAASRKSTRIVVTAREALLVWDLAQVLPRRVPNVNDATFASETIVVSPAGMMPEWEWLDLRTGLKTTATLQVQPAMTRGTDTASDDGRVLSLIERSKDASVAVIGYPNATQLVIEDIEFALARLVAGNGIVYSTGKGRVFGKIGSEPARELVTVDGDVESLSPQGRLGYTVLSRKGELVRGSFDGSRFTRAHVDVEGAPFVSGEADGGVLIAMGNRLLRWAPAPATSIDELARFEGKIDWLMSSPLGTFVGVGESISFMAAQGDHTPRHLPVGSYAAIAESGRRVVSINGQHDLEVLELPSRITWTLPNLYPPQPRMTIAPSGKTILQNIGTDAALWQIPEPASDFAAWLDELTNATEVDRHLVWPWEPAAHDR